MAGSEAKFGTRVAAERQLFAQPLRALVARSPVVCEPALSCAGAARLMRAENVGSVVVLGADGQPAGIVTGHDLVTVLATGQGERPVGEVMSRALVALESQAFAYEAAILMTERGIRHVVVLEGGRLLGVVSERDLFALQRLGLGELTMEIRLAASVEALAGLAREVRRLGALLVEQGVAAEPLTLFVSVLNDRLTSRLIEVVRKRHDRALERIGWCWLAFGSEGRLEQTFSTDQDNGMAFVSHEGLAPAAVRERLLPFAREVNEALDACGFPLCRGNVMASNPALCLTVEEWQAKMAGWIEVTGPKALLDAAICFDLRPIYGDATLLAALREWIAARVRMRPAFLRHLAEAALEARPALGRMGGLATEDAPGAPASVNLKLHGAKIFVDAARVLALAHGLAQTNTADRLRAAARAGKRDPAEAEAHAAAFWFIQSLRLEIQAPLGAGAGHAGRDAAHDLPNRIAPATLNAFRQAQLKEALRLARELQQRLALDYQL